MGGVILPLFLYGGENKMTRKAFEFKKSYEEIEVAGITYQVDFSDEKIVQYYDEFEKYSKRAIEISEIDTSKITKEEEMKLFKEAQGLAEDLVDLMLGKGEYAKLYEMSGRSTINMTNLISYLKDVINEFSKNIQNERKDKYLVKKKR